MYTITVSNLNDSGAGSLRQAITDANAYTGSEDIIIVFDDALAGKTLTLLSGLPELSKACTFDAKKVTLALAGTYSEDMMLYMPSDSFAYFYEMVDDVTISSGYTMSFAEGVVLGMPGRRYALYIDGTLEARNEIVADTVEGGGGILVRDGGKILLENANILLASSGALIVETGGTMDMQGGNIQIRGALDFYAGASADLKDVEIVCRALYNAGKLSLTGTKHDERIINSGVLNMLNVTTTGNYDVSSTGTLTAKGVILGSYLDALGASTLENVTCTTLYVDSIGDVVTNGTGVILTSDKVIGLRDFSGNVDELLKSFTWTATSEGEKYIGLTGTLGDTELTVLPESFTGEYKMLGSVTVKAGSTMTLGDGVCISRTGDDQCLNIEGTLEAKNSVVADALLGANSWNDVRVSNGGKLLLENANVNISGNYSYFEVYSGGTMEMVGGSLQVYYLLDIAAGGAANLEGVDVQTYIYNSGTLNLSGTTHGYYVTSDGVLDMLNVTLTGNNAVSSTGTLTAKDVTLGSYLEALGASTLENVTCTTLYVDSDGDVETNGTGVILTSDEVIGLVDFSGNVDELLESFTWTATSEEEKYIGLIGSFGDTELTALPESFTGGYKMVGGVMVKAGTTMTLGDGVTLRGAYYVGELGVYGTLIAHNTRVADMIVTTWDGGGINVFKGGKILLENANVKLSGSSNFFYVENGGVVEMRHGSLQVYYGLQIDAGGTANLEGVDVQTYINNGGTLNLCGTTHSNYITNSGELTMSSCDMQNQDVTLESHSKASITNTSGIGKLTINSGCHVTIQGNDFSGSTIVLNDVLEGDVIDLSGNYWGTTDFEEIIGKIQGYDESRVLINSILLNPNSKSFSFDSQMLGGHRVPHQSKELVLVFNADVDSSTVSEQTIRLIDAAGQVLQVSGYVVSGNRVTLMLDGLPQGSYNVQVESGLCDVYGNAFTEPEGQRKVNFLSMELSVPKVIFFRTSSTVTDQFRYVDIFFDQDMDASTITTDNVHIYTESGQEISINRILQSGEQGNMFFRAYFDRVTEQGTYQIVVDAAVQTIDGRHMDAAYMKAVYVSSPDLEISDMVEYSDNRLGRYTNITYTVHNTGDGVAQGSWTDSIYLCKSATWDESQAVFFASVQRNEQTIAPGESYTATARALLGGLEPGEYYIFVKSDVSSRLRESQESNNLSAIGTSICLTTPAHELGTQIHELSSANEVLYVAYTATENASIRFTVEDVDARIYVSEELPTASNSTAKVVDSAGELSAYFMVEAGKTYYIAVEARKSGELRTLLEKVEMGVFGSSLSYVSPGCECSLIITGIAFTEGMKVWLEDDAGNKYDATSVGIIDACKAKVTIVLPHSLENGTSLTLCAESPSGSIATMEQKLKVDSYSDSLELKFYNGMNEWSGAAYYRVGYVWKTDLSVKNIAVHDLDNAIVLLNHSDDDFAMYYGYDDAKVRDRSALLYMVGNMDDSPLALEAGESAKLKVYIKAHRDDDGAIQTWVLQPGDATEITKERWNEFASALRPTACDDDAWAAWWGNVKPRIGTTTGDFVAFIYGMQEELSMRGHTVQVSSMAELVAATMTYSPDYVPGYVVEGVLTEWGTSKGLAGVTVNLHKRVGDVYELVGTAVTDNNGHYVIRHDGTGVYYVSVPGLSVDVEGDGYIDAGIPEFEIGNEDKVVSPYVVTVAEDEARMQGESDIEYADNGDLGRLWLVNGYLSFAIQKNGVWSTSRILHYAEKMNDFALYWDDSLNAYVVFWNEINESGELDSYVQLVSSTEEGDYQVMEAVQMGESALSHTALQSIGTGLYVLVSSSDSVVSCLNVDLRENHYWQEVKEEDLDTSAALGGKFNYPIKMPFGKYSEASISGSGSIDKKDECKVVVSYELNAGGSKRTWHGQYDWDTWSVSGSLSETVTYYYTELGEKAEVGSGRANLTISFDSPDGLIYLMKHFTAVPIVSATGHALFLLKNALSKIDVDFDLGYKVEFTIDASWNSGKATIIQPTLTVTIYGGVEDKKDQSWYARASGTLSLTFKMNMTDLSYVSGSFSASGNLHYEVKTPSIFGWSYESSGDYDFGKKEDDVEEISFTRQDVPKMSMVRSLIVGDTTYTITSKEHNNFSMLSITANKGGELYSVVIDPSEFSRQSDLLLGRGYITDITCSTLGGYGVITIGGYVGEYIADENVSSTELIGILDTANYKRTSYVLYVKDGKVTDKWGSIPDEEIPEGDKIQDTKHDETEDGKVCRVEVVLQSDGQYAIYYSETQDGEWTKREKVTTCKNKPLCVDVTKHEGNVAIIYTETDFSDGNNGFSETFMWTKKGNSWVPMSVACDNSGTQTAGTTMLQSFISALGVKPWALLADCPNKDDEEPDAKLEDKTYNSYDPNDIYGPVGYGSAGWIAPQEMQFQIVCENKPEENIAHAAQVIITQQIDAAYDYSTFRLGDMTIAGNYITVEGDVQRYNARLDWTDTLGVWVDVNAWFDADTGIVTWEFAAIDPETGYFVADPFTGLLAPNYNPPEGDGGVYYYVTPKATATTGTEIKAEASIVFDYNEPIATPTLTYTLDEDAPEAVVKSMAAESSSRYLYVAWEGSDVGSGVDYYNIFVSIDGGEWQLWQNGIAATSALYTVAEGEHTYAFFSQGVDHAGNAEALSELMAAEAATVSTYAPSAGTLTVSALSANRTGDALVLRVVFSEAASCSDWAAALRLTAASGAIDLSNGSFSYDAATHTLTWTGSVAGVADGEKATLRLADGMVKDAQGVAMGDTTPSYSAPVVLDAVAGATYAAPTLVDYNGDGLLDMLVGENANGKGQVRIYLNEGTAEVADYASFIYAQTTTDTPLTLDAEGCQGAIVRLADVTGDGVAEMLIGLADGTVRVFTVAEGGYWSDAGLLTCMMGGKSATIDVGTRAAIDFVDANGDGRVDMLVGTGDGNIVLYLDTAATGVAVFDGGQYLHDTAGRITLGNRASVSATDVDGDGLWDLLVGSADGSIHYYRNEGRATEPLFGEAVSILAGDVALDLSESTDRVRIDAADINGDGLLDIAVGQSDGSVKVLYGTDGANLLGEVVVGNIPLPDAPQQVQISVQASKVTLSWDAVAEESGSITYEVSYCMQGCTTPTVVSVSDITTTLELPDGIYAVQVRALNYGMGGAWSAAQTVTVDTVAPETPAAATAVGGETSASISWSSVADAASYELRYRSAGSSTWRIVTATETSQTLTDVAADGYEWQVRAVDAAGNASEWTSVSEFTVTGVLPDYEQHWATGLVFDAQGSITGGYYDVNKLGVNDSQLCWAAAATNVLTWWQDQGDTALSVSGVPTDAASIYATFCGAWENASGVDAYGFIWWLAGESTGSNYADYYDSHYTGDSSTSAYYEQYYTPQNVAQYAAQVSLKNTAADTLSTSWDSIYAGGGMITLGIFRSVSSNGTLSGGHSLTLWGYETEVESGMLTSIYVTDSDDGTTALITLDVEYDNASGLYRVAADAERIGGYYLGAYNYLKGFTNEDIVAPEVAMGSLTQTREEDGTTSVNFVWQGNADAVRYELVVDGELRYSGTDTSFVLAQLGDGEHSYTIRAIDAAGNTGEYCGTLRTDAKADDAVYHAADIELGTLPGGGCGTEAAIRNWVGDIDEQDYFRISSEGAGSYSIGIDSADVDTALWLSVGTMNAAGQFVVEQELLINPDSAVHGLSGVNLGAGETRYIRVSVADGTQGTDYALTVKGHVADSSMLTDNNSLSKATQLSETTEETTLNSWVGAGDALDFYRLEMAQAGRLSINLSGLEQNAKLRVYQERADGELTQKLSTTAKASSGLDRTLSLTAGTYFIEVAAYDKGAGLYNSTYALELEKEDKSGTKHYTLANG